MKLTDLRGILQYVPQFREKTFILAIDGAIVTDDNFATLLLDVALLWSLNVRVVLVHGASAQIRTLAGEHQVKASDLDGTGVTDASTLDLALTAANRLTHEILEGLSTNDLRAATTNVITAHPLGIIHGVDHLFTGKVERVDTDLLQSLLNQGVVPVIPPLGFDGDGRTYRVNSDGVALAVAEQLKAVKLIFVSTQDGLIHRGQVIRQMLVAELNRLVQTDAAGFAPDMLSKAQHAAAACQAGVPRAHVINGTLDEGLLRRSVLESRPRDVDLRQRVRAHPARQKKDVRAIQLLTKQAVEAEELVKRTKTMIEKSLGDYYIFEIDRNPVACVALHVYPEQNKGELACLYVSPHTRTRASGAS